MNFWQEIDVKDLTVDKKPVRGLSATSCSRSGRPDHPRVKLTEPWAKKASGVAAVELDVRFLNITTYAGSLLGRGFDRFSGPPTGANGSSTRTRKGRRRSGPSASRLPSRRTNSPSTR